MSSIHISHDQDALEVLDTKDANEEPPTSILEPAEAGHGGDVESEVHDDAQIESEASDTAVEEDIESPSEKAARLKQEAKLAAEKAQAEAKEAQMEARRQQAAAKAAEKVK